jgi:hypothetical protein
VSIGLHVHEVFCKNLSEMCFPIKHFAASSLVMPKHAVSVA